MPGMWSDVLEGKNCRIDLPKFTKEYPYMPTVLSNREAVVKSFIRYIDTVNLPLSNCQTLIDALCMCLDSHILPEFWYYGTPSSIIEKLLPEMQQFINDRARKNIHLCPWGQLSFSR